MKLLRLVLACSIAGNLVLAALLFRSTERTQHTASPATPPSASASPASAPAPAPSVAPPSDDTAAPALAAGDFGGLSARLSAAGVPSHIARVVLTVAIKEHFERLRAQRGLRGAAGDFTRNPVSHATSESVEIQAARRALDREEQEALATHIGADHAFSSDRMRQLAGLLPSEKANRLLKIVSDYRQMEAQLYLENPDRGAPANRERVALLQKEQRADIERLLTPEELLDYDLRTSALGGNLRNRIGLFPVSETEFRALYTAFQQAEAAADAAGVSRRSRDRDVVFEPEFRRVLGEARYADLQRARELEQERIRGFTDMLALTKNFKLPGTAPNDVLVIQAEFRPQLAALQAARNATPEQRDAQIAALVREADRKLAAVLGSDALTAYRARQGQWLPAPTP